MSFGVVIPNRYPDIIQPLVRSINNFTPDPKPRILIISDGHNFDYGFESIVYREAQFVFAKSVNLGIQELWPDDVILLNDDCVLLERDTFARLDAIGNSRTEIGILSPLIKGCVGNLLQRWHGRGFVWRREEKLRYEHSMPVCFPCVWLRRRMLNGIGNLDESYIGYGGEDNDLCARARQAGWRTGVTSEIVVQHGTGGPELESGRGATWSMSFARRFPPEVTDESFKRKRQPPLSSLRKHHRSNLR